MDKLHNEELRDLYSSLNIVKVIRFIKLRSADYVAKIQYFDC